MQVEEITFLGADRPELVQSDVCDRVVNTSHD